MKACSRAVVLKWGSADPKGYHEGISRVREALPKLFPPPLLSFLFLPNLTGNAKRWLRYITCMFNFAA